MTAQGTVFIVRGYVSWTFCGGYGSEEGGPERIARDAGAVGAICGSPVTGTAADRVGASTNSSGNHSGESAGFRFVSDFAQPGDATGVGSATGGDLFFLAARPEDGGGGRCSFADALAAGLFRAQAGHAAVSGRSKVRAGNVEFRAAEFVRGIRAVRSGCGAVLEHDTN